MSVDLDLGFEDMFRPLVTTAGAFLLVVALATIISLPWATNGSIVISLVQLLGVAGTTAIGAGLIWLGRN